ncbi:phosphoribosylformylglycinamidine synthase [Corynebacterium atypicum]|uniref:Phosphoribosylformylglycinamidine synthase subunit PurQ n=1 Tax=Corynebacterium atypicum TaxID=191610 RepID=A0ABN4DEI9_9CORY|nr:phosphoribosylformylglycinamidine synthase subunit PurQ [Corynebacterium atypicum]AIG64652.1 phosphoribosylformylglycinamidine synthase [Corynebacterium atypicum]
MTARIGVITFPGTLDDVDAARAVRYAGAELVELWHADEDLKKVDAVVVPGGFSYGDYLRSGAISALAPVMRSVVEAAGKGMPVLGICNGFQILTEAHLLPGALTRNRKLNFHCVDTVLTVENNQTAWTSGLEQGAGMLIPAKHGEGRFQADRRTLDELEAEGRVVFRYTDNFNGSMNAIAGIASANGRVVGLMPHPEHAIDLLTGPSTDGLKLFTSVVGQIAA